ncbi:hypothetical protein OXPF_12880 [Oxobacter pfennigii]|uniref:Chromosome partition protein Smc n=1 Tax=Oxobacter pfennigii TaxID=36849 RepID=A0A0P8X2Z9_9CLOT|nr:hypothetical protein [Oxobacter pfennigii]KPU45161.1 hypothetical protein OXPF_12880 [Oxobacter pfennigii]
MEDKTFELVEKMYIEFSIKFEKIDKRFDKIENEISEIKKDVRKVNEKLDGPINDRLTALEDGYKLTYEKLTCLEKKVDVLSDKVDKHDIRIEVIEGGRRI